MDRRLVGLLGSRKEQPFEGGRQIGAVGQVSRGMVEAEQCRKQGRQNSRDRSKVGQSSRSTRPDGSGRERSGQVGGRQAGRQALNCVGGETLESVSREGKL